MTKILLIYPNIVESPKDISIGLATISALLKKHKHKVQLLDSTFHKITEQQIKHKLKEFQPDLVGITAATNDLHYAIHICKQIKQIHNELNKNTNTSSNQIPILCGGYHATIAPEDIIKQDCFDAVCIGEGEYPILELVNNIEKSKEKKNGKSKQNYNTNIKNIWFKIKDNKGNIKIIKNKLRPLQQDLDKLPFPDRNIFDYQTYLNYNKGIATFIASKGCPFGCAYCINNFLLKEYTNLGKYLRFRTADSIIKEIKQVIDKYKDQIKEIEFYDDTFTLNKKLVKEFSEKYSKQIGIPFNINIRAGSVTKQDFVHLKNAGCYRVSIGIESGDEFIRNKIMKRNQTDQQIIDTFKWAREAGLQTYSFNMVGLPYETEKTIKATIKLNKKCEPDFIGVSIFNAYKGTELYGLCEKNNWLIKDIAAKSYFQSTNVKLPSISIKELKKMRDRFGFLVYKGSRPLRAYLDLFDKSFIKIPGYLKLRSLITKLGMKRLLKML